MANRYLFYAYQIDFPGGSDTIQSPNGAVQSLPTAATRIYAPKSGTTAGVNSVTINAVVELLPSGLNTHGIKYYTDSTVSTLNTAGA